MDLNKFNELQQLNGTKLVYTNTNEAGQVIEYVFMIDDQVDDDDRYFEMEDQLLNNLEEGIEWCVARGDDIVHAIAVKDLSLIENIPGLEKFIEDNIGSNCYTR